MQPQEHWNKVYHSKASHQVSWFQEHAEQSLQLIQATQVSKQAAIIDVGAGASTLVDDLLTNGYLNIHVLDISEAALQVAQQRLDKKDKTINWLVGDITTVVLPYHTYDVWHDRAVFHFLTTEAQRHAYVQQVLHAVKPNGHVIISTFAEDGPLECSGLPVQRYSPNALHAEFGTPFKLLNHYKETHKTPWGSQQSFIYCYCRVLNH